mgnify:CR=1 FL=1
MNIDPLTCSKAELRKFTRDLSATEKKRIYRKRWEIRNPGETDKAIQRWTKNNPKKRQGYRDAAAQQRRDDGLMPYHTEWARSNREKAMLSSARYRAKKKSLEFNITSDDVVIPERCPVFGFLMETSSEIGRSDASPSLDRIDNSLGYIKGNVIVVSWLANRLKNDASPQQLRTVANFYEAQAQKAPPSSL